MAQTILRNEDFKSSSIANNVQGIIYRGEGLPLGRISSPNLGAIYVDNLSGMLWMCAIVNSSSTLAWKPFNSDTSTSITIDNSVQNGDLIGIFGVGSWVATGNLNAFKHNMAGAGRTNAAFVAGGNNGTVLSVSELFNGSAWTTAGNLNVSRQLAAAAGSQNAGLVMGGINSAALSSTELFNGTSWAASGSMNFSKNIITGCGSQFAALVGGGFSAGAGQIISELFNGSIWTVGASLSVTKHKMSSAGAQNAGLVAGGTPLAVTTSTNNSEIFNGTAWSLSSNLNISRQSAAGMGSQTSAIAAQGSFNGATSNYLKTSEIFNGSAWALSGSISFSGSFTSGAGASQGDAISMGGVSSASTEIRNTSFHVQSIYRKLDFSNIQSAINIGVAYNVSVSSLTATLMLGNVSSQYIPYFNFFGISKFNNDQTNAYISSTTSSVVSISALSTNNATVNLTTTFTNCFWKGMILLDAAGNKYPVVGGTASAPIVRWANVSNSASPSLVMSPVWGHRFENFEASSILLSANSLVLTMTTSNYSINSTVFQRFCRVGGTLYIPYSTISGTNGSSLNYGSYYINSVSGFSVSVTKLNTSSATESLTVGNISIYQHAITSPICLGVDSVMLGYMNKIHVPYFSFNDDTSNGSF